MNKLPLSKVSLKQALIGCGLTLLAGSAVAAPTGSVTPGGNIPGILDVTLTDDAGIAALDLTLNEPNRLITTVNERTNNKNGYTVTLTSLNGTTSGVFLGAVDAETLPYTMTYNGIAVALVAGSATVTDVNAKTLGTGVDKALRIAYDGTAVFLAPDAYADTLTFTIAAK